MTKLKLGPLEDDKPVKLTIELPTAVFRDLKSYAEILTRSGNATIPIELANFDRADDRAFHGNRPRLCEGAAKCCSARTCVTGKIRIALAK
ncbi:hypothetical protein ABIC03_005277 [Bradyrhizobium sp. RT6a]